MNIQRYSLELKHCFYMYGIWIFGTSAGHLMCRYFDWQTYYNINEITLGSFVFCSFIAVFGGALIRSYWFE